MKNRITFFLLAFQSLFVSAQTLNITSVEVCAAQEVLLPITGTSLLNMGALTLFIGFDTNNLVFDTILNLDNQLAGVSINLMTNPTQLALAWSSTTPANIPSGKLFDIKFISSGQTAPVSYNPGCELADPSGTIIPATYTGGAVNSALPIINQQPQNQTIIEGSNAQFSISSPNALSFNWMESQDHGTSWLTLEDNSIYSGTHSSLLTINQVPLAFNQYLYKCLLIRESCQEISVSAVLNVDEMTTTLGENHSSIKYFRIKPTPVIDQACIEYNLACGSNVALQVFTLTGSTIFKQEFLSQNSGLHHIVINTLNWQPGLYFVRLCQDNGVDHSDHLIKMIKAG